jgi:hypothetical protein
MAYTTALEVRAGDRAEDPGRPGWRPEERRAVLSKAKRLRLLIGAFLLALSVSVSGVAMTGCGGGVTEEQKKEAKKEAEKKEEESKKKQEEKEKTQ